MKKALVILAEGFEEIEAVTPIDLLRRTGVEVTTAGVTHSEINGARGIRIIADAMIKDVAGDFDALILPGGMPGATNLAADKDVTALVASYHAKGKIIAAICASPAVVLAPLGILDNKTATCYPGMEKNFNKTTRYSKEPVIVDGTVITSRGPATAFAFALAIAEKLAGQSAWKSLKKGTLYE